MGSAENSTHGRNNNIQDSNTMKERFPVLRAITSAINSTPFTTSSILGTLASSVKSGRKVASKPTENRAARRRRQSQQRQALRRRNHFETLEPRLLLSATPFDPDVGVATEMELGLDVGDIELLDTANSNALIAAQSLASSDCVIIDTSGNGDSNETIVIDFSEPFFLPISVDGGDGDADLLVINADDGQSVSVNGTDITVDDGLGNSSVISVANIEQVTINLGGDSETLEIAALTAETPALTINGGAGDADAVVIQAAGAEVLTAKVGDAVTVDVADFALVTITDDIESINIIDPDLGEASDASFREVLSGLASHLDLLGGSGLLASELPFGGFQVVGVEISNVLDSGGEIRIVAAGHGLSDGDQITLSDIGGVPNANGSFIVQGVDDTSFVLSGSTFSGSYVADSGSYLKEDALSWYSLLALGDIVRDLPEHLGAAAADPIDFDSLLGQVAAWVSDPDDDFVGGATASSMETWLEVSISDGSAQVYSSLAFTAGRSSVISMGDGDELNSSGLDFSAAAAYELEADISSTLTFDLGTQASLGTNVGVEIGELAITIEDDAASTATLLNNAGLDIGLLEATVAPAAQIDLSATISIAGPGGIQYLADLVAPNTQAVTAVGTMNGMLTIDVSGVTNPADVNGLTGGTLSLSDGATDLFTEMPSGPLPTLSADLDGFAILTGDDLLQPLDVVANWLLELAQSEQFDISMPLLKDVSLGDGLDLSSLVQSALLDEVSNTQSIAGSGAPDLAGIEDGEEYLIAVEIDGVVSGLSLSGTALNGIDQLAVTGIDDIVDLLNDAVQDAGLSDVLQAEKFQLIPDFDPETPSTAADVIRFVLNTNNGTDLHIGSVAPALGAALGFSSGRIEQTSPEFTSIQDFIDKLKVALGSAVTVAFDSAAQTLSFTAELQGSENIQSGKFSQNMALEGFAGFEVPDGDEVEVSTVANLDLEFGVQLTRGGTALLSSGTLISFAGVPYEAFDFSVQIDGASYDVAVAAGVAAGDADNDELVAAVDAGLVAAGIGEQVSARLIGRDSGDKIFSLALAEDSGATTLRVLGDDTTGFGTLLGFANGQWSQVETLLAVDAGSSALLAASDAIDFFPDGYSAFDFSISLDGAAAVNVAVAGGATDFDALADAVNAALVVAGLDSNISAQFQPLSGELGTQFQLALLANGTADRMTVVSGAGDLGLVAGQSTQIEGVGPGFLGAGTNLYGTSELSWNSSGVSARVGIVDVTFESAIAQGYTAFSASLVGLENDMLGLGALAVIDPLSAGELTGDLADLVDHDSPIQFALHLDGYVSGFNPTNSDNRVTIVATLDNILADLQEAEVAAGPNGEVLELTKNADTTTTSLAGKALAGLTYNDLILLLDEAVSLISNAHDEQALNLFLPLINMKPADLDAAANNLGSVADGVAGSSIATLQDFLQALLEQLGEDYGDLLSAGYTFDTADDAIPVQFNFAQNEAVLGLRYTHTTITEVGFGLDVSSLAQLKTDGPPIEGSKLYGDNIFIVDPLDNVELAVEATSTLAASMALNYSGNDVAIEVADGTAYNLDIVLSEPDLDFEALVGPTTVFIKDASVDLDASYGVVFGEPNIVTESGSFQFVLPMYENASITSGIGSVEIGSAELQRVMAGDPNTVVFNPEADMPNLAELSANPINQILTDPSILIDGLDRFLQMLQTAIEAPFAALENVPIVGAEIMSAVEPLLQSINDMRESLVGVLNNVYDQFAGDGDQTLFNQRLREALLDLFGPAPAEGTNDDLNGDGLGPRLGLLQDLPTDGDAIVDIKDILFSTIWDEEEDVAGIEFNMELGQSLSISLPFEFGFGVGDLGLDDILPGFGFQIDAADGVTLDMAWEMRLGFGLSTTDGFFIVADQHEDISNPLSDDAAELRFTIDGAVPGLSAELALGLLQTQINDGTPITPTLVGDMFSGNTLNADKDFSVKLFRGDVLVETIEYDHTITTPFGPQDSLQFVDVPGSVDDVSGLLSYLKDLNYQFLSFLGGLEASADLSNLINGGDDSEVALLFTSRDPSITRIEIEMSGEANGLKDDMNEQFRSIGLGFDDQQLSVENAITAAWGAPTDGNLKGDVALTIVVAGMQETSPGNMEVVSREVEITLSAEDLPDDAGLGGLTTELQGIIDLAIGEAGFEEGAITIAMSGGKIRLAGDGDLTLESISWDRLEHTSLGIAFEIDLEDQDWDADGVEVNRGHVSILELIGDFSNIANPSLEMEAEARFHINANTAHITDFVENALPFDGLGLPSLEFDFEIDAKGSVDFGGGYDFNYDVSNPLLDHIQLNAGDLISSVIQPVLGGITEILGPILNVLGDGAGAASGFLDSGIPVISEIADFLGLENSDGEVTYNDILDLLSYPFPNPVDSFLDFVVAMDQAMTGLAELAASDDPLILQLGGWIVDVEKRSPTYIGKIKTPIPKALGSAMGSLDLSDPLALIAFLTGAEFWGEITNDVDIESGGFKIDLLTPGNVLNLIVGETFDIVSVNMPSIHADVGAVFGFDLDILDFGVDFGINLDAELSFVYDSTGFDRIADARAEGVDPDYADLLDGFYIRTVRGPEFSFGVHFAGNGGIEVRTPEICLLGVCTPSFVAFGADAMIHGSLDLGLDLRDPNEDGALRLDEIMDLTDNFESPQNLIFLFDATLAASFGFDIGVTLLGISLSVSDIADEFGLDFTDISVQFSLQDLLGLAGLSSPLFEPRLGEVVEELGGNKILRINAGEFDYARIHGDTDDAGGISNWTVSSSNDIVTIDDGNGHSSTFDNSDLGLSAIVFRGTNSNDSIDFSGLTLDIPVDARGGLGNDTITGGAGNDVILGESGADILSGMGGADMLNGGDGDDQLYGGSDIDLLIGGEGADRLAGGGGADQFVYGTGRNFDHDTVIEVPQLTAVAKAAGSDQIQFNSPGHALQNGDVIYVSGLSKPGSTIDDVVGGTDDRIQIAAAEHGFNVGDFVYVTGLTVDGVEISNVVDSDGKIRVVAAGHSLSDGDEITLSGIGGVTNANDTFTVESVNETGFVLSGSSFAGTYVADTGSYLAGVTDEGAVVDGLYEIAKIGAAFIELKDTKFSGNYRDETGTLITGVRDGTAFAEGAYTVAEVSGNTFELAGSAFSGTWNVGDGAFFEEGYVRQGSGVSDAHAWVAGTGSITPSAGGDSIDIANISDDEGNLQLTVFNHGLSTGNLIDITGVQGLADVLSDASNVAIIKISDNRFELVGIEVPDQGAVQLRIEDHGLIGLSGFTEVDIIGVAGVPGANGSYLLSQLTIVDANTIQITGSQFSGNYDSRNSLPSLVVKSTRSAAQLNADGAVVLGLLTDTLDFDRIRASQALDFIVDTTSTRVFIGSEEVKVNSVTVVNDFGQGSPHQVESLMGSAGEDDYEISAGPSHFLRLDGAKGSDDFTVYIGDDIEGDIFVQDTGPIPSLVPSQDRLFVEGSDDEDTVGLTNEAIFFGPGKSISYSPGGADSGLELLRVDLQGGDDEINVESTPATLSATLIGNLGNDVFNIGVMVNNGVAPFEVSNLNAMAGIPLPEGAGPLNLHGFDDGGGAEGDPDSVDQLFIYDVTDTGDNKASNNTNGLLEDGLLTGLGMGAGVAFSHMEELELRLGQGDDELRIEGIASQTRASVMGSGGSDNIRVAISGSAGPLAVYGDAPALTPARVDAFGNDVINAFGSSPGIFIYGGPGTDTLTGGNGNDVIAGGSGNDTISGSNGADQIYGDSGLDMRLSDGRVVIVTDQILANDDFTATGAGQDTINGDLGDDIIFGDHGWIDTAVGSRSGDGISLQSDAVQRAGQLDTVLRAETINESVGDNDTLDGGGDQDIVFGGLGIDTASGGSGNDIIIGDMGVVHFDDNTDDAYGFYTRNSELGAGDILGGDEGDDIILGGTGGDAADGGDDNDIVIGDQGKVVRDADLNILLATITEATVGGIDTLRGGSGNDVVIGGTAGDILYGDDDADLMLGDHASIEWDGANVLDLASNPAPNYIFTSLHANESDQATGNDEIHGGKGDDILLGQQGTDTILGGADDDDIIGGHNQAGGLDTWDNLDGGRGNDVIAGDNALILRDATFVANALQANRTGSLQRTLSADTLYQADGTPNLNTAPRDNSNGTDERYVTLFDHEFDTSTDLYGSDNIAGGGDDDIIFGQLGDDRIQGDGRQDIIIGILTDALASEENSTDGDDYIEGNGGNDLILGNLGQDDIIGGSSDLFGLDTVAQRMDGNDRLFGGAGTRIGHNDLGLSADENLALADAHGRDADVILGDNGRIVRPVYDAGQGVSYLGFNYDTYGGTPIVVRTIDLLDYTIGGDAGDIGAADLIIGGGGDDIIHGMTGDDILYGNGEDDDIYGEHGNDWISGGAGQDGVIGDDGIIWTSRNTIAFGEPLYSIAARTETSEQVKTPGNGLTAYVNIEGSLQKTVDLWDYGQHEAGASVDDIIFGGLGSDFLHGGDGNDAMSGAEALEFYYGGDGNAALEEISDASNSFWGDLAPVNPGAILNFNTDTGMFADYDPDDPRQKISWSVAGDDVEFLLNFDPTQGPIDTRFGEGLATDGDDAVFGGLGNDWLVGGTGRDHLYGGMGNDLLNADDDQSTANGANNEPDSYQSYADIAAGGSGRDVMIANAGVDRLVDPVGEFNSFLVPFSAFGAPTIIRSMQPQIFEFMHYLALSDGADPTLDSVDNPLAAYGEGGFFTNGDDEFKSNVGGPRDPQPGNDKAKRTLRVVDNVAEESMMIFNDDPLNTGDDQFLADIASGGSGVDVMITNTGVDRLLDPVGKFNNFLATFSTIGEGSFFTNGDDEFKFNVGGPRDSQPGNDKAKRTLRVVDNVEEESMMIFNDELGGFLSENDALAVKSRRP
jgi:Ca2+-binding RTX toxin-like protein